MKFDISHVAEFAYGLIISDVFVKFGNVLSTELIKPIVKSGVDKAIGEDKRVKICNTELKLNTLLVALMQVLLVFSVMYILLRLDIKPSKKLF